jgi:hypothetical protein
MENPLSRTKSYFSGRNFAKFHPEKKEKETLGGICACYPQIGGFSLKYWIEERKRRVGEHYSKSQMVL